MSKRKKNISGIELGNRSRISGDGNANARKRRYINSEQKEKALYRLIKGPGGKYK